MVVDIEKERLLKYWARYGAKALPWLKGRPVTLEQVFEGKVVYRRHPLRDKHELLYINTVDDILLWAKRHTYSFHPYICHSGQRGECWYVLDIDPDNDVEFKVTKFITFKIAQFLLKHYSNIDIVFCGKNGFHIFAKERDVQPEELFERSKRLTLHTAEELFVLAIQQGIELRLTSSYEQALLEKKYKSVLGGLRHIKRIHLDTRILHKHANIRSPYSIHPVTGLTSLPVKLKDLLDFDRRQADIVMEM